MRPDHNPEHFFAEKKRISRLSQIRELIFGAQDGLLVPLGVTSSIAGAFNNNHIVIIAGIAETLAGAFSMATGAYLASHAQRQVHINEINKERQAIERFPKEETEELIMAFENEGLNKKDAVIVVGKIASSKKSFFNTMVQKELGIDPEPPGTPTRDALFVGVSYLFSALIPLLPYFFIAGRLAIVISILLTLVALFFIGIIKGKFASLSYIRSGLEVLLIGAASGIGGYFLGTVLPHILGAK